MAELPSEKVTLLRTNVQGSTALWEEAPEAMRVALARHDALFEEAGGQHRGVHIRPCGEGESRFAVFVSTLDAVAAAVSIHQAFADEPWLVPRPVRVRIGLHTGEAELRNGDYHGSAVNRCARLRGIGHSRQQACGPNLSERRPMYVVPHIKGDPECPLKATANRVSAIVR